MITRYLNIRRPEGHSQRPGAPADEASLIRDLQEVADSQSTSQASSIASSTPPTPTPHRIIKRTVSLLTRTRFEVSWANLWYENKLLRNPRIRPPTKQPLSRQNSYIWQYGLEIEADGYSCLWLCQICHQLKAWHSGVYTATSTAGISAHLQRIHSIQPPAKDYGTPSPGPRTASDQQSSETHCTECGHRKGLNEDFNGQ